MNYSTVENLIWCGEDRAAFDCRVTFDGLGVVPFTCAAADPLAHSQSIWSRAMAGEFGPIADPLPPPAQLDPAVTPQPEVDGAQTL
jgi:hypothetical protein